MTNATVDEKCELKKIVSKRCIAARRAAGLGSEQVATLIGHKNSTQLSLIESADRLPSLVVAIKLAKIYAVPLDYLMGIIDDPIAEPLETNQGAISYSVRDAIQSCMTSFQKKVSEYTAMAVMNHSRDRVDLMDICLNFKSVAEAQKRIRELNPNYDDEIRAGSKLDSTINHMIKMIEVVEKRIEKENKTKELVNSEIEDDLFSRARSTSEQSVFDFFKIN